MQVCSPRGEATRPCLCATLSHPDGEVCSTASNSQDELWEAYAGFSILLFAPFAHSWQLVPYQGPPEAEVSWRSCWAVLSHGGSSTSGKLGSNLTEQTEALLIFSLHGFASHILGMKEMLLAKPVVENAY